MAFAMIDLFALAVTHVLMLYIAVNLHVRKDLDSESVEPAGGSEIEDASGHA
jgi:hypothetical protein